MNNKLIMIVLSMCGLLVYLGKSFFNGSDNKQLKIAILLPVSHVALDEVHKGFVTTLAENNIDAQFDVYNANGNRTLLRGQAEEIAQKEYDLIFTVAISASIIMKEVLIQRNKTIPLVCGAVDEPVKNGLIKSMDVAENNITAVTSKTDFKKQLDVIMQVKPTIKKILLVYNPNANLERHKKEIEGLLVQKDIGLTSVEVFTMHEMMQKVSGIVQGHDLVFVLKDNMVVSCIEGLVSICNRFRVPLYVSDLNSVEKGAALGYGVQEYAYGQLSAQQALKIVKAHQLPCTIPSVFVTDFKVKINKKAMELQGLHFDDTILTEAFMEVVQ